MLEDLSLLYVFGLMFCLKEFNFREKLEEKNENNKKYFKFLNKRCKTKKPEGAKCKKHKHISTKFKISEGAPAPPHHHRAPPLTKSKDSFTLKTITIIYKHRICFHLFNGIFGTIERKMKERK
jgi:hypothetical protein